MPAKKLTTTEYTYRIAERSDAEALVRLINRAFIVEEPFFTTARIDLDDTLEHFEKGTFLIAESRATVAGCNYVELRGDVGYFGLLSVDPDHQGNGLGRIMIEQAEDFCRAAGCSLLQIRVLNHRTELPRFYEKLGYTHAGIENVEQVPTARKPYHFLIMEKTPCPKRVRDCPAITPTSPECLISRAGSVSSSRVRRLHRNIRRESELNSLREFQKFSPFPPPTNQELT